jgi:hypothetical protein
MESIRVFEMNDEFTYQELINEIPKLAAINAANNATIRQLEQNLKIAIDALKNLIDKTEYGVNQWQKAWSPDKETEGQKAIKKARQALEKIKRF